MQAHLGDEFRKEPAMKTSKITVSDDYETTDPGEAREYIAGLATAFAEVAPYFQRPESAKDAEQITPVSREAYEVLQSEAANVSYAVYESQEESCERLAAHGLTLQDIPRYICTECERVYQWRDDDIAAAMERPFMPCGHHWDCLGYVAVRPV